VEAPETKTGPTLSPQGIRGGYNRSALELGSRFNSLAESRLEETLAAREQYLLEVLHELKSPISRLRILLHTAQRNPRDITNSLARIEDNIRRMDELTRKLLDFSRLEVNGDPIVKESCDLTEVVSRVVENARIEAGARGCTIKHSTAASCAAYANCELLQMAVENVVRNSIQYTRQNSSVVVVLSCPANGLAQIVVEDEGPGICAEELDKVFKPFYRAAHTRALGTMGVGLGLSIAQRAVDLHRGSIMACNRSPGKGLRVIIQIPVPRTTQTIAELPGNDPP
jgi:signal transduction histidine kinase